MRIVLHAIISLLFVGTIGAQIDFALSDSKIGVGFRSGSAVVSIDVNGDGLDDLVRLDEGTVLCVDLSLGDGTFTQVYNASVGNNEQWNLVAADLDQDGAVDIVTSGVSDRVKVMLNNGMSTDWERTFIEDERFFAQCSNIADVNADGIQDIFVCDDNAANKLYIGEGDGTYTRNDTLIDFNTVPASDNSGNYGSVWTDFDLDGDLDLYISKCRVGVGDPTDPRRINMLYVNTDTGYTEAAAQYGIASGGQSWSSDFADIDNDGDMDLVVINHDVPAEMFENNSNTFTDITASSGIDIAGVIIQSIFRDFDNDGLVDLLVTGSAPKLYHNKGNRQFEVVEDPFPGAKISSFTIGDFNNDGFPDVYGTYNELYNTPSDDEDDKLWLNVPNANNHIRIKAHGTASDMNAIGAKLYLHGAWGTQIREIRAGESYGIGTSLVQNFGLGTAESIDSLVVVWADGFAETFLDLNINALYNVFRGECATEAVDPGQGPFTVCGDTSITLTAPDGFASYQWNTGQTDQTIVVSDPGMYFLTMTDQEGCKSITLPIPLKENDEPDSTSIFVDGSSSKCFGESILLVAPEGNSFAWSTGETTEVIEAEFSGQYSVTVTRVCNDATPEAVSIILLNPADGAVENDTVQGGGSGVLTAAGDSVLWFADAISEESLGAGNVYQTVFLDTTTAFYAEQFGVLEGESANGSMQDHVGADKYNGNSFNGGVSFDAAKDFRLDSVKVYTEFAGMRTIVLLDSGEVVVASKTMNIDSGVTYLNLMFDVEADDGYLLTTDETQNIATFGFESPQLYRSTQGVEFPYSISDVAQVNGADFGPGRYYYFFDFHITSPDQWCSGARQEVLLVVEDTTSSAANLNTIPISAYPNPVRDRLFVQLEDNDYPVQGTYTIMGLDGRMVKSGIWRPDPSGLDVSDLMDGLYVLEVTLDSQTGILKFVKQ